MKAHSDFCLDKYTRTVWHPASGLPEVPISPAHPRRIIHI